LILQSKTNVAPKARTFQTFSGCLLFETFIIAGVLGFLMQSWLIFVGGIAGLLILSGLASSFKPMIVILSLAFGALWLLVGWKVSNSMIPSMAVYMAGIAGVFGFALHLLLGRD
jgi:hypothetical protein